MAPNLPIKTGDPPHRPIALTISRAKPIRQALFYV
jgi:hypothetical protein